MKNAKAISMILTSYLLIAGCSSNKMNNHKSPKVDTSTEKLEMLDSSSKSQGRYVLSESEKDKSKVSQDVNLIVDQCEEGKLTITLYNNSSRVIDHGYAIFLEKKLDGAWYSVVPKAEYADETFRLDPGHEFKQNENLARWEENHTGLFRMVKIYSTDANRPADETEKISISKEFELKE